MSDRSATYDPAPDVAAVATGLITEHHPDLLAAPIVYVFRTPASKHHNRIVLGRALRVMGLNAFLVFLAAGDFDITYLDRDYTFFVMEIARPQWEEATPAERLALVDHELCHFDIHPETGELKIRAHNVEEFAAVAHRHGAWSDDIAVFLAACDTHASPQSRGGGVHTPTLEGRS